MKDIVVSAWGQNDEILRTASGMASSLFELMNLM
jgi:hypothetical protein